MFSLQRQGEKNYTKKGYNCWTNSYQESHLEKKRVNLSFEEEKKTKQFSPILKTGDIINANSLLKNLNLFKGVIFENVTWDGMCKSAEHMMWLVLIYLFAPNLTIFSFQYLYLVIFFPNFSWHQKILSEKTISVDSGFHYYHCLLLHQLQHSTVTDLVNFKLELLSLSPEFVPSLFQYGISL